MTETELLNQIEDLKFKLRKMDEERNLNETLEKLKQEHRGLKSPDSPMILYLIRRHHILYNELARLKKTIKGRENNSGKNGNSKPVMEADRGNVSAESVL